jgi:ABC-type branched-subunit amino acid transport system ATPase component
MFFPSGTVAENIELARAVAIRKAARGHRPNLTVSEVMDRLNLAALASEAATTLSFGMARKLGLAMVMMASPQLVLLDEPAAGLNDVEAEDLATALRQLAGEGVGIVVVDHDMPFVMGLANTTIVLDAGKKIAEGHPDEVTAEPAVITAYLGSAAGAARREPRLEPRPRAACSVVLRADKITVDYGSVAAVRGVDIELADGESLAILGANGAGKTSLLRAVCRLVPSGGSVQLDGKRMSRDGAKVARSGVVHVLEGRHIFTNMTVAENLRVGLPKQAGVALAEVLEMFPVLKPRLAALGGALSGGQQQSLAIARALMRRPKVLVLDEPTLGLSPVAVDELAAAIQRIRAEWGSALLIAEQSVSLALAVSERYVVLRRGQIVAQGSSHAVNAADDIFMSYLGQTYSELMPEIRVTTRSQEKK